MLTNLLSIILQSRQVRQCHELTESENADLPVVQPDEAVRVVDPLPDEVFDQRTFHAGHRAVLQRVEEEGRVVVHSRDGDLKFDEKVNFLKP